jgi:hypothetical protein
VPDSLLTITVGLHEEPATVAERVLRPSGDTTDGLARLARELPSVLASSDAKITARVDAVTRRAARARVVCSQSDSTAGDKLHITIPGWPCVTLTAVSGAATGRQYSTDTDSDAMAASVAAAINRDPLLSRHLTANDSEAPDVLIPAREPGSWAHGILVVKEVTTAGALTITGFGVDPTTGTDVLDQPRAVLTFGAPDIVNDNTVTIGSVVLTWKASPSGENQIETSTNETTAATRFAAAVNAHSRLRGQVLATRVGAVVEVSWLGDPRAGELVTTSRTETNAGAMTWGAARLTPGSTLAYQADPRTYGGRGAA